MTDYHHINKEHAAILSRVRESEAASFEALRKPWLALPESTPAAAPTRAELDAEELTADGVLNSVLQEAGLLDAEQQQTQAPALSAVDPVALRAFNAYPSMRAHLLKTDRIGCMALEAAQIEQIECNADAGQMFGGNDNATLYAQAVANHTSGKKIAHLIAGPLRSVSDIFLDLKLRTTGGGQ